MKTTQLQKTRNIVLFLFAISLFCASIMYANTANLKSAKPIWCYKTVTSEPGVMQTHVTYCGSCQPVLATSWSGKDFCDTQQN